MQMAERSIEALSKHVDTLIIIPNQNLSRVANEKTTFAAAFAMADQVLYLRAASITELMTKEGLINPDFADVRAIMSEMGKAMMGTGEASGEKRAVEAAEAAISNPLLDVRGRCVALAALISITGGPDLTLYEVDEAATRIQEVDPTPTSSWAPHSTRRLKAPCVCVGGRHRAEQGRGGGPRCRGRRTDRAAEAAARRPQSCLRHRAAAPADGEASCRSASGHGGCSGQGSFLRLRLRSRILATMNSRRRMSMRRPPPRFMGRARPPRRWSWHGPAVAQPRLPPLEEFPPIVRHELAVRQGQIERIAG